MICHCGFDSPLEMPYCGGCGAALGRSCDRCAKLSPLHFRFCGHCGAGLEAAGAGHGRTEAERRLLTVMFCDLVDSTRLSGQLDPEDLRTLVLTYQQLCVTAVEKRGGYVSQYLGDGILAYFGYPRSDEHAVAHAVAAGLEMQAAVERYNRNAALPIQVRVGLHTGWAVVGEVGSGERREQLALGETPNVAARIQGLAAPGGVAVSQETERLARGVFRWESLGTHALKGVDRRLEVFRAVCMLTPQASRPSRPMVGRDEELAIFRQRWSLAREGSGQAVLLRAEAGMGKSRIVLSFLECCEPSVRRQEFRCSPFYQNSPLLPIIEAYRTTAEDPSDWPGSLGLTPQERALVGGLDGTLSADARARLFGVLSRPFQHGPSLLVFEDVHWADASTCAFVQYLLERLPSLPMLIVLTARPQFRPAWLQEGHLTTLNLARLAQPKVEALIRGVAAGRPLSQELLNELVRRSDGNPLFAEELTLAALEGSLPRVPDSLSSSLAGRLDRLGPAREVAQMGALLGREFPSSLLEALSPVPVEVLSQSLETLTRAEILYPMGSGAEAGYTFKHALLAEAAYESMLLAVRRGLHEQTARILQQRFPEWCQSQPELLAHHWLHAEHFPEAVQAYREAARLAGLKSAEVEAIEHLRNAQRCLEKLPEGEARDREELLVLAALGPPLRVVAGNAVPEVRQVFERAERLLTPYLPTTDPVLQEAGMSILYGRFISTLVGGQLQQAGPLSELMVQTAGPDYDRVVAHSARSEWCWTMGRFDEALKSAETACQTYRPELSPEIIRRYAQDLGVHSYVDLAEILVYLGRPSQALLCGRKAVELARQTGHRFTLTYVLLSVARVHLDRRERAGALELLQEASQLAGMDGSGEGPLHFPVIHILLGLALADPELARRGIEERRRRDARNMQGGWLTNLAELLLEHGRREEALRVLDEAVGEVAECGEGFFRPELERVRGEALGSEPRLLEAYRLAQEMPCPMLQLRAALSLAGQEAPGWRERLQETQILFPPGEECPDLERARCLLQEQPTSG